jgi:hypothetical protein
MSDVGAIGAIGGVKRLTPAELAEVAELTNRDRQVRLHEAQHLAAAGGIASGLEYSYETGPDGRIYAVGGQVHLSIRAGATPEATLAEARVVRAAATAPADPSDQDLQVAAEASQMEQAALQEIAKRTATGLRASVAQPGAPPMQGFNSTA